MFAPANQSHFDLAIQGQQHDFKVLEFTGKEAICEPYCFELVLVCTHPDLDIEALLHQSAFLTLSAQGNGVHGLIYSVAQGEAGKRLTRYRITLVPHLAYLAHRTNQRIFQHLSVPQIITKVLEEHGIHSDIHRFQLGSVYPEREYCTQYDETDLNFIQRLCEEEGIHFHFEHASDRHVLVFGDDQTCFPKLAPTSFEQGNGMVADQPVIKRMALRVETRPVRVTRRDYDFEKPRLLLESDVKGEAIPDLEDYAYPGRFTDRERGKHLAQRSLERHRSDYRLAEGESDQPSLVSGHFLALNNHSRTDWNDLWLLTGVEHQGKQPQVLEESITSDVKESDGFTQGYRNRFTATPWDAPYRPQLKHPKPRIRGHQTAVVTGPGGEEIHCDRYGRIKVQFHWDREGQADDKTSCWMRVSSSWAGDRYGGVTIPRVGMEVLVSFLEGDPDQPLVTGCLYHREHEDPYELPANKSRTVFKTHSTPGGGGFNELRIEDKKGAEQIFIHAQRDHDCVVQNNESLSVGVNRSQNVGQDELITVGQNRFRAVQVDDTLLVGGAKQDSVSTQYLIEAGQQLRLVCGESVIELNANGVINLFGNQFNLSVNGDGQINTGGRLDINMPGGAPATAPGPDGAKGTIDGNVQAIFNNPSAPTT